MNNRNPGPGGYGASTQPTGGYSAHVNGQGPAPAGYPVGYSAHGGHQTVTYSTQTPHGLFHQPHYTPSYHRPHHYDHYWDEHYEPICCNIL